MRAGSFGTARAALRTKRARWPCAWAVLLLVVTSAGRGPGHTELVRLLLVWFGSGGFRSPCQAGLLYQLPPLRAIGHDEDAPRNCSGSLSVWFQELQTRFRLETSASQWTGLR